MMEITISVPWFEIHFYILINNREVFQISAFSKLKTMSPVQIIHHDIGVGVIHFENSRAFNIFFGRLKIKVIFRPVTGS